MYYLYKIQCIMSSMNEHDAIDCKNHLKDGEIRNDVEYIISSKDMDFVRKESQNNNNA